MAAKLKNDYDRPIPDGSLILWDLKAQLFTLYSQTATELSAKRKASHIMHRVEKIYFKKYVIKNPDSVKNKTLVDFFPPDTLEVILSINSYKEDATCFKDQEQLEIFQIAIRNLLGKSS